MKASRTTAATLICGSLLLAGCSSQFGSDSSGKQSSGGKQHLTVLIGSSGDAETNAVTSAARAWATRRAAPVAAPATCHHLAARSEAQRR